MGVPRSLRKESKCQYVMAAMRAREKVVRLVEKFPASYRYSITNNVLDLAKNLFNNAMMANDIYICRSSTVRQFNCREEHLLEARCNGEALLRELSFTIYVVNRGNNFLGGKEKYLKKFYNICKDVREACNKMRKVMEYDRSRFEEFHLERLLRNASITALARSYGLSEDVKAVKSILRDIDATKPIGTRVKELNINAEERQKLLTEVAGMILDEAKNNTDFSKFLFKEILDESSDIVEDQLEQQQEEREFTFEDFISEYVDEFSEEVDDEENS